MKKSSLSAAAIKKLDKSKMLTLLLDFPQQCSYAKDIGERASIRFAKRDFGKIVFAGLGGSAIGADLVRSYLYSDCSLPITVLREYTLPAYVNASSLVFIASYSGNTEETLSAYQEARKKGATIIALSSGGKIKELAVRDNVTFIEIPKGIPPRCALGYQSIIPLCVLGKLGIIKDTGLAIKGAIKVLEDLRDRVLTPEIGLKDNIAKSLANSIFNKFTVIYSASIHFDICATRMRGQLAENSKALASSHVFPEMNHNEIVGWEQPKKLFKDFVVVMLRDKDMHPRTSKRMDITADILRKDGVKVIEVWSHGEELLARILSLAYIGDFVSYYLAILYGIDPTPVDRVTYLKNQLAKG
ncbi:MAG: bifunctional phosphoglucose/phosphomannose isomerase [Candidatus Omnitrophota bacterium]